MSSNERCWGEHFAQWDECEGLQAGIRRQRIMGRLCCDSCIAATALTDSLTGLSNRHHMAGAFEELKSSNQPFGALTFDLENFKNVNDSFGHEKGDQIIKQTAEFLRESVRENDTVCIGRRGGDEFAILLKLISRDGSLLEQPSSQLEKIGSRIKESYETFLPVATHNKLLGVGKGERLGIKYGYALWVEGMDIEELLAKADAKGTFVKEPSKPSEL